jgi:NitT/TauT family transport system permease protein
VPLPDTVDGAVSPVDPSSEAVPNDVVRRVAQAVWPPLVTVAVVVVGWQCLVWSGWRPDYVLPPPSTVLATLWSDLGTVELWRAVARTLRRAAIGFVIALLVGGVIGLAISRWRLVRRAIGSLVTGLQTMPSIAWFPFAILLFQLSEAAILFVVVLGAAPSIANGIVAGVDAVPPLLRRVGTMLGGRGWSLQRELVVPAAMPAVLGGIKQGWAFAWRSLLAGELLVVIAGTTSLGHRLQTARELSDADALVATMIVVLALGIAIDAVVFGRIERRVLERRGLGPTR